MHVSNTHIYRVSADSESRYRDTKKEQAETFLRVLSGKEDISETKFTFQVFPDKSNTNLKARHFSGTLDDYWDELVVLNHEGFGIFVMVNEGDCRGRATANVLAVRALFVDLDKSQEDVESLNASECPPNLIVESSPGRLHAYWRVTDCRLQDFKSLQQAMIKRLDGDPSVHDLPRVMRLPGLYHQKELPVLCDLKVSKGLPSYSIANLVDGFGLSQDDTLNASPPTVLDAALDADAVRRMLEFISPDCDYLTWIRVASAIKSALPRNGLEIFDEWSKKSPKYVPGETTEKWDSLDKPYNGRKVGIGTLIFLAKKQGYRPPAKASRATKATKKERSYEDYISFVLSCPCIRSLRVDKLSRELMAEKNDGTWVPAFNLLKTIESFAVEQNGFVLSNFERHLHRYKEETTPSLLIDIPKWDGVDRVREICNILRFKHFSSEETYELLSYWGTTIFRRLDDPSIQPVTLILRGAQGCGKDTLINALIGGLGDYAKELNLDSDEAEQQLHTGLVFRISEFDKSAKLHVATLKHLLTSDKTYCRLPYDRRAAPRYVRCSFIASCNVRDLFRDYTGNRRYWALEMEFGGFKQLPALTEEQCRYESVPQVTYPGMFSRVNFREERLQILAQFQESARLPLKGIDPVILKKMSDVVDKLTPRDPDLEAVQLWHELVQANLESSGVTFGEKGWLTNFEINTLGILDSISKLTGLKVNRIKEALKRANLEKRTAGARGFKFDLKRSERLSNNSLSGLLLQDDGE